LVLFAAVHESASVHAASGRARISMMARNTSVPFTGRIQKRKTITSNHRFWLATRGRSIQSGHPKATSALSPFNSQLRTLIGAARRSHSCHKPTHAPQQKRRAGVGLFNHLVGVGEQGRRHVEALMRRELPPADLVFLDEAHLWFKYFRDWLLHLDWRDMPLIGLSATPWTRGLGAYYDELIIATTTDKLRTARDRRTTAGWS
jgi:hypothetical protein